MCIFCFRSEKPTREGETGDSEASYLSREDTPSTNLDTMERIETELESEQEEIIIDVQDTENRPYSQQRERSHNSRVKFLLT